MHERPLPVWIICFLALNLYTSLTPRLFDQQQIWHWALYWTGFFIITHFVARHALKLGRITSFGVGTHTRWALNVVIGFTAGASVYIIKYLTFYKLGRFEIIKAMDPEYITDMLSKASIAMLFSSLINDIMIKGYWLAFFKQRRLMNWFIIAATSLYAVDDVWNEGFDPLNILFSLTLGLSLAYTVFKTGSVWMAFGMHWGGNMVYRALYGFSGKGIWETKTLSESIAFDWISIAITALLLPIAYLLIKAGIAGKDDSVPGKETKQKSISSFSATSV